MKIEVDNDRWVKLTSSRPKVFVYHNKAKQMTVWCNREEGWFMCYINQGQKIPFKNLSEAQRWAKKQMTTIGGQQVIRGIK